MMELDQLIPLLEQLPPDTRDLLLRLLLLVIALFMVWLIRGLVTRLIIAPIKSLLSRAKGDLDEVMVLAVEHPIRLALVGVALRLTTLILDFGPNVTDFAIVVSRGVILAAVVYAVYNLVETIAFTSVTLRRVTGLHIEDRLLPFLRTVTKVFILVVGFLGIVQVLGYDATALIASFGVVGIAIGLAAQDTASNFFSFAAIVSDNPFQVGDYIQIGDGIEGLIERVGWRSTRIRKLDQSVIALPNNKLAAAAVVNWSRLNKRRLDFSIGLTFDTSSLKLRNLIDRLRDLLKSYPTVDAESVWVHFSKFNTSSLDVQITCYVKQKELVDFYYDRERIFFLVMELLEELGLRIAFPTTTMEIRQPVDFIPQQPLNPSTTLPAPEVPNPRASEGLSPDIDEQDSYDFRADDDANR